jgi:hypothetical protein
LNPSVSFTRKRTVPQWHAASISPPCIVCIAHLLTSERSFAISHITMKVRGKPYPTTALNEAVVHHSKTAQPMSAMGQKQTSRQVRVMSALPPKADIAQHGGNVRFCARRRHHGVFRGIGNS